MHALCIIDSLKKLERINENAIVRSLFHYNRAPAWLLSKVWSDFFFGIGFSKNSYKWLLVKGVLLFDPNNYCFCWHAHRSKENWINTVTALKYLNYHKRNWNIWRKSSYKQNWMRRVTLQSQNGKCFFLIIYFVQLYLSLLQLKGESLINNFKKLGFFSCGVGKGTSSF